MFKFTQKNPPTKLLFLLFFLLTCSQLYSQTEYDAYRFSEFSTTGTARSLSMGGAFTATGGDLGNLAINPAGIGLFTRSEIQFSMAPQFISTSSNFLGSKTNERSANFAIPSFGMVIYSSKGTGSMTSFAFGFGYNQWDHHRNKFNAVGFNSYNSVTNYFANLNRGVTDNTTLFRDPGYSYPIDDLGAMAYNTYFTLDTRKIDEFEFDTVAVVDVSRERGQFLGAFNYGNIEQRLSRNEWGRNNEWNIGFSGNFDDRFQVGLSIGIPTLTYEMNSTISESDVRNIYNYNSMDTMRLSSVSFSEKLISNGTGINLTLGLIYQPLDFLRLGLSFKTPSIISMSDQYSLNMDIRGKNQVEYSKNSSSTNTFDYTLYTPLRLNTGVCLILGKTALISVDAGLTNYGHATFSTSGLGFGGYFNNVNKAISNAYNTSYNVNLGTEIKIVEEFSLRGGFAYFTNPLSGSESEYKDLGNSSTPTLNANASKMLISGGVGYKSKSWFLDVAVVHSQSMEKIKLYNIDHQPVNTSDPRALMSPTTINDRGALRIIFTLGITFGKRVES